MRLLSAMILILAAVLAVNAAEISGIWKGTMETQGGAMETTIALQDGPGVAGTVQIGEMGGKIENGKMEGDRISFEINISYGKVAFEGTVAGEEMKLAVTGTTGNKYSLTCKHQK
jgi:hypothetical protein